jgi:hypothetical protein
LARCLLWCWETGSSLVCNCFNMSILLLGLCTFVSQMFAINIVGHTRISAMWSLLGCIWNKPRILWNCCNIGSVHQSSLPTLISIRRLCTVGMIRWIYFIFLAFSRSREKKDDLLLLLSIGCSPRTLRCVGRMQCFHMLFIDPHNPDCLGHLADNIQSYFAWRYNYRQLDTIKIMVRLDSWI